MKVLCISESKTGFFRKGKVYKVAERYEDSYVFVETIEGMKTHFVEPKVKFIPISILISAVAFLFVLTFAMTGESVIDNVLKSLFGL